MGGDEVLEREERDVGVGGDRLGVHAHEPRHVVGHLDPREALGAALRIADGDSQVQRQPRDVGERVGRVDRERGEDREDLRGEVVTQAPPLLLRQVVPAQDADALVLQLRADVVEEHPRVRVGDRLAASRDARQLLPRGEAVGAADGQARLVAALEPGDADHVELVEVRGEDREELGPLQQRLARVLGQREHAGVEVEPRQLAVEIAVVGQLRDRVRRTRGRADRNRRHVRGRLGGHPGGGGGGARLGPGAIGRGGLLAGRRDGGAGRAHPPCGGVHAAHRGPGRPAPGPRPSPVVGLRVRGPAGLVTHGGDCGLRRASAAPPGRDHPGESRADGSLSQVGWPSHPRWEPGAQWLRFRTAWGRLRKVARLGPVGRDPGAVEPALPPRSSTDPGRGGREPGPRHGAR